MELGALYIWRPRANAWFAWGNMTAVLTGWKMDRDTNIIFSNVNMLFCISYFANLVISFIFVLSFIYVLLLTTYSYLCRYCHFWKKKMFSLLNKLLGKITGDLLLLLLLLLLLFFVLTHLIRNWMTLKIRSRFETNVSFPIIFNV